jgi:hypothetical protein
MADKENNTITYYVLINPTVKSFINTSLPDRLIMTPDDWT